MKILIVSPQACNPNNQSRALLSLFKDWSKNDLHQLYTDSSTPKTDFCSSYLRLTDSSMLDAFLKRKKPKIDVFSKPINDIDDSLVYNANTNLSIKHKTIKLKKNNVNAVIRNIVWGNSRWKIEELKKWALDFKPDYVFLDVHSDSFFNNIGLYLANITKAKMALYITDDYLFSANRFTLNPFSFVRKRMFVSTFKKIMKKKPICFYVSDRMNAAYSSRFHCIGNTEFICSDIDTSIIKNETSKKESINLICFGSMSLGRLNSLLKLDRAISATGLDYTIHLYPNTLMPRNIRKLKNREHIVLHNRITHDSLVCEMKSSDAVLLCEGMSKKHATQTKYSLSTKVADCLAVKKPLIAFGNRDNGTINFLKEYNIGYIYSLHNNVDELKNYLLEIKQSSKSIESYDEFINDMFDINSNAEKFKSALEKGLKNED